METPSPLLRDQSSVEKKNKEQNKKKLEMEMKLRKEYGIKNYVLSTQLKKKTTSVPCQSTEENASYTLIPYN